MRNTVPYHRLRKVAKERPLLSVFLGSFLTASAIPLIVFLTVVMGSLTIGVLAFTAFQSGVIVIACVVLCVCLALPLFMSGVFALLTYCGLAVVNVVGGPLKESNISKRWPHPMEMLTYLTARVRAIASANPFRYLTAGGLTSNTNGVRSNQQRDPASLVQLMQIIDSDDDALPVLLRPRQDPLASLMNRRAPSFDFLAAPSRHTYEAHSFRVIQIQDNRGSGVMTDKEDTLED
ncbi:uncharacterized protein LOC110231725 [Exaiptasia diaphana]|uniref:Uncharacterized protein n=1 Tax=Exaiptasia diaphana TaxID=2652724 RepID=A0A913WQ69_EXADI|nr:uncharacterized protein LOC110231725 [Exaiptasia diaphana]KXJ18865.1 hypothetical protein AC249_AIPGENE20183 [Exaiptasia diaphana]